MTCIFFCQNRACHVFSYLYLKKMAVAPFWTQLRKKIFHNQILIMGNWVSNSGFCQFCRFLSSADIAFQKSSFVKLEKFELAIAP